MNEELRAITKNQRNLDSAVIMSSLMPWEKYSCSGSPLMLTKGSTAMAGRSGSGRAGRAGSCVSSGREPAAWAGSTPFVQGVVGIGLVNLQRQRRLGVARIDLDSFCARRRERHTPTFPQRRLDDRAEYRIPVDRRADAPRKLAAQAFGQDPTECLQI
jgi:hypothetical protein